MVRRSYESSSVSSEIVTPKGRKVSRVSMAARDGKGAARLQKEKNGTIVKDDLVLFDKEGMHPLVMRFFADELEKQAIYGGLVGRADALIGQALTSGLLRGIKSKNRVLRKISQEGAAALTSPQMRELANETAQYAANPTFGPAFYTAGTVPGHALDYAATRVGVPRNIAKALTWNMKNNPF